MEPIGSMISNIFSSFMSSLIPPTLHEEETSPELEKTKRKHKIKKYKIKKYKIRKYGIKKYKRKYI
jgi:hypothetical protein